MLPGIMDLPRPKDAASLRMQAAQQTLRIMRMQGHDYIDIRQDGKRIIYICIICLKPCYSEPILVQHLEGKEHKKRLRVFELTMRLANPWPFNDGMVFFNLARDELCSGEKNMIRSEEDPDIVVPDVLWKGGVCNIGLKYLGLAEIGARLYKDKGLYKDEWLYLYKYKGKDLSKIRRIWCQWKGETVADEDPEHGFVDAVVTFRYSLEFAFRYEDETEETKQSFSDPEDISVSLIKYNMSSFEDSTGTRSFKNSSTSRLHLSHNSMLPRVNFPSDELLSTGSTTNSELRKEIKKKKRLAVIRVCGICQHKMHPGKDVAALLNLRTRKLACSSRNINGVFHMFHVSCLLQWILLCEYEAFNNPIKTFDYKPMATTNKRSRETTYFFAKTSYNVIQHVICPTCQGTGKDIIGTRIDRSDTITPRQISRYKRQIYDGRDAWRKDPEILPSCSIGLDYPPKSEENVEELTETRMLKPLPFYTVVDLGGELAQ